MKKLITSAASLAVLGLSLAACSNSDNSFPVAHPRATASPVATAGPTSYTQIERLSRPAVKEVFEPFNDHKLSNAAEPWNDSTIAADIPATEDFLRAPIAANGAKGDYGATLASVLYPDEYLVNLNGSTPSGADPYYFLSTEVSGGTAFGGRAPNDDVINLELGVLFGGTLPALGLTTEDNKENTCLSTQNIAPEVMSMGSFPYLAVPH